MKRLVIFLAVITCLTFVNNAQAGRAHYSSMGAAAEHWVQSAQTFWHDRDVLGCDQGVSLSYQNMDDVPTNVGWGASCQVWLSPDRFTTLDLVFNREKGLIICAIVYHEVGHALGLSHTPSGVMASDVVSNWVNYPWDCIKMLPRYARMAYVKEHRVTQTRRSSKSMSVVPVPRSSRTG